MISYETRDGTIVLYAEEFTTESDERAMIGTASPRGMAALLGQFAAARHAERQMSQRATDAQKAITFGTCVTRRWETPDGPLVIWGTVLPLALVARDEMERGAAADAVIALEARLIEGYARGWRYGRWYSTVTPEGELGAAHVADLTPVTVAEFDAAQWRGWTR